MPEIQMPKLSDTMTEGTLVAWKKKKGDKVSTGDVIAEIETDKATMEWESPEDGVLTEIFVEEGGKVEVGERLAFIGEEGEKADLAEEPKEVKGEESEQAASAEDSEEEARESDETETPKQEPKPAKEKPKSDSADTSARKPAAAAAKEPAPAGKPSEDASERHKASPVARRLAGELGVDLGQIKGSGPEGRITESDVRAAAKAGSSAAPKSPAKSAPVTAASAQGGSRIQLGGMRKVIAERLVASKGP
ncbi:MAG: biotin/lipoyl-containing protein, partial [Verrucomicrobiota bacterium]